MAILIQSQVDAAYSFVLHSKDPFSTSGQMYAELAVGLGETLASGNQPGVPYKLAGTQIKGFANYSTALRAKSSFCVDYSQEELTRNQDVLE